jgi:DNA-binding GntR family transcriptional regulator
MSSAITDDPEERAAGRAYRMIRRSILNGGQPMGSWLREEELAGALGVSRTPVREALHRLNAEGLVAYLPKRGVQVVTLSDDDLAEIFGLRCVLEPYGAALAARHASKADLDALSAIATAMVEINAAPELDVLRLSELNYIFHDRIIQLSGHVRLRSIFASLLRTPLFAHTFTRYSRETLQRADNHHLELLAAIRTGDGQWSSSIMYAHIRAGQAALLSGPPSTALGSQEGDSNDWTGAS